MKIGFKEYFLLINYKTKERVLCSWWENEPYCWGRKVYYIGVTNGLGGYHNMIAKGFIDRRFSRDVVTRNKVFDFIEAKRRKKRWKSTA